MIHPARVTVTTAGTRVALAATRTMAAWVQIQNSGNVANKLYVGDVTVSATTAAIALNALDVETMPPVADINGYDLSTIYIDADTNGMIANIIYFRR